MFSGALLSPVALVHAQGSFAYTLFTPAGIRLTPGNSGTTTIVATLTAGEEHASNVTLACDLISLPPANFSGTTCSFRSEERRVGKECRSLWVVCDYIKVD